MKILALDVGYKDTGALSAGVLFDGWTATSPLKEITTHVPDVEEYVPGEFYKRELPCILAVLSLVSDPLDLIIIDGYVDLGTPPRDGLGAHLWNHLGGSVPIVGVAKTRYAGTSQEIAVHRNGSTRALYVTARGIPIEDARSGVLSMSGSYRIPDMLKLVDTLSRT